MRKTAVMTIALALAACSPAGQRDTSETELRAANAGYDRALIAGDAAALGSYFTDDFQLIDDDANVRGKQEQIRVMTQGIDLLDARSDQVRIKPLGPNHALLTGRFSGRYRIGDKENRFSERYTSVWVRQGGEWKIQHEHASLVPAPKPKQAK